jgi:predicted small integral membrane protein
MARKKGVWAMKIALSIGIIVAFLVGLVIWLLNRPSGSPGLFNVP